MASGHVNRANRRNTWLHRSDLQREKVLANSEPSTRRAKRTFGQTVMSASAKGLNRSRGRALRRAAWQSHRFDPRCRCRLATFAALPTPKFRSTCH
jgi:hypothetical protein